MTPPRTTKEEIAAKKAWRAEKEKRRAERASDESHRSIEVQRKAETEEAERRRLADLHDDLEETNRRLALPDLSTGERQALEEEKVRVLRLLKRANRV